MNIGTIEEEIQTIRNAKYHVVILGAGASYAAFPGGDKNGKKLPLMNNFVEVLNLEDELKPTGLKLKDRNFEEIYDDLYREEEFSEIRKVIEQKVYDYFFNFELYQEPTIYDYLLLSLREKDLVATFNWDPLLVQAYRRNTRYIDLPHLVFLHGNVTVGYCQEHKFKGNIFSICPYCHKQLSPTPLLYPITEKNYGDNEFIAAEWKTLQNYIENAFLITFFGYSAPKSDIKAIELIKKAWGDLKERKLEQIEIIDIKSRDELKEIWKDFIYSHHYDTLPNYFESWMAKHPRRTYEAYFSQELEAKFIESNPIPKYDRLEDLRNWFGALIQVEQNYKDHQFKSIAEDLKSLYLIIEENSRNSDISIPKSFQSIPKIITLIQKKNYRKIQPLFKSMNPLELSPLKKHMDTLLWQKIFQILKNLGFKKLPE